MRRQNTVWWALLALSLTAIVISVVVTVVNWNPAPSATASPAQVPTGSTDRKRTAVTADGASTMLLGADHLNSLLTMAGLQESGRFAQPGTAAIDRPECGGAVDPATESAYADSGMTAVAGQSYRLPNYQHADAVVEALAVFPDATAATAFAAKETTRWKLCERALVTVEPSGPTVPVGEVTLVDDVLQTSATSNPGSYGWLCQRALTAVDNAVADVKVCNFGGTNAAGDLATAIANRVRTR